MENIGCINKQVIIQTKDTRATVVYTKNERFVQENAYESQNVKYSSTDAGKEDGLERSGACANFLNR